VSGDVAAPRAMRKGQSAAGNPFAIGPASGDHGLLHPA
jgi:hypothetical protein